MSGEQSVDAETGRRAALATAALLWETLLLNQRRIRFRAPESPQVSIVIVSFNAPHILAMTLLHLAQHLQGETAQVETIIVDNASDRETQRLLDLVDGAIIIRNVQNMGFGPTCNQGAARASGRYILFLNPDIDLMPGAIDAMIEGFSLYERVGIVGARLVFPGGKLQEAGCHFADDQQLTHPYLRGHDDASAPEALYAREVGYVSGAALMIEADHFAALGGFDPAFAPAYFEDTDLCVRSIQSGRRVVYQPRAVAIHYESATSPKREAVERLLDAHRTTFLARHSRWLFETGMQPTGFMARDAQRFRFRVLYIDDQTPHVDKGAGLPRANSIVNAMAAMGYLVTVLPVYATDPEVVDRYRDLDPRIEIVAADPQRTLARLIDERSGYYDVLWASRPHNIALVVNTFLNRGLTPRDWIRGRVIFDTEAVFASRDAIAGLNDGRPIDEAVLTTRVADEVAFCKFADLVVCVSPGEERVLRLLGGARSIRTLGHALPASPGAATHAERTGVLFVGPLLADDTPNVDSIEWYLDHVFPIVAQRLGAPAGLTLVGEIRPDIRRRLTREGVTILGRLDDLAPIYARCRLTVAPTRFAAGIPQKVHHSVAHGVPIVVTSLIGAQLGWSEGEGFLSAPWQDPAQFADAVIALHERRDLWDSVRSNGLARVRADLDPAAFAEAIRDICEERMVS